MSGQITSDLGATAQLASRLAAGARGYGGTSFSRCADVSDAVAASQHDDAGGAYSSAAKGYGSALGRDARAIARMGVAFRDADIAAAELMLSLE